MKMTEQLERGVMAAGIAKAGAIIGNEIYIADYQCSLSYKRT